MSWAPSVRCARFNAWRCPMRPMPAIPIRSGAFIFTISLNYQQQKTLTTEDTEDTEEKQVEKKQIRDGRQVIGRRPVQPTFSVTDSRPRKHFNPSIFLAVAFPPCPPWFTLFEPYTRVTA